MDTVIALVFLATYAGMALGTVPGLRLDRTGIALVAVVILLASGAVSVEAMGKAIDLPTLLLLFALMIVSAQFRAAGFYDWVANRLADGRGSPRRLVLVVVLVAGGLSALLANDVIAFAMAPILAEGARRRGLDPRPLLVALAGACNAGSAMTVIGNPQNILIGQAGNLGFWGFLAASAPAGLASLAIVYVVVSRVWRAELTAIPRTDGVPVPPVNRWQTAKGTVAVLVLAALFATPLPRDIGALIIAALLLTSRHHSSRGMIGAVDGHLLLLFACLFTITAAFASTGFAAQGVAWLARHHAMPDNLTVMAPLLVVMSNTIGNVPAVMLILSVWHQPPEGVLYGMALLSTLAGNLLIGGSLANIIVVERAAGVGVRVSFRDHLRAGVPMTLLSMLASVLWLAAMGYMRLW